MIRPLRDAQGIFHEEPDELASTLEAHGLKLFEAGRMGFPVGVLPFLEEEAIARLRHATGPLTDDETGIKAVDWERWRCMWVNEAHFFMRSSMQGPLDATVAYAAAEVLVRAGELRGAIDDGSAEKAAALAMMVASWVFTGGVSIRLAQSEPVANRHKMAQRTKAQKQRFAIKADDGNRKKIDYVSRAYKAADQLECTTTELWPHLISVLEQDGFSLQEGVKNGYLCLEVEGGAGGVVTFTYKGVQGLLAEVKKLSKAPAKKGRPRKKPA